MRTGVEGVRDVDGKHPDEMRDVILDHTSRIIADKRIVVCGETIHALRFVDQDT